MAAITDRRNRGVLYHITYMLVAAVVGGVGVDIGMGAVVGGGCGRCWCS